MRILQVAPSYYPELGGVEHHVQAISEALAEQDHNVTVATTVMEKGFPDVERMGKVVVKRFRAIGTSAYRIPFGLFRYLKEEGPSFDVIHAHNYGAIPLLLAVWTNEERTVITPHYHRRGRSIFAELLHKVYDPFAVPILCRTGKVVCVSAGEAEEVVRGLRITGERVVVIPNAMRLQQPDRVSFRERRKESFVLCVGRLDSYKRVDKAIKALPHLAKEFTLIVIGEGPEKEKLERLAASYGVQGRVQFMGSVGDDELHQWYIRSKVAITLSEGEAFGRVVIEALASGCGVVCSDNAAFRDFSRKFPSNVTLVSKDAKDDAVAKAIESIAKKPLPPVNLHEYTADRVVNRLLKIYQKVVAEN